MTRRPAVRPACGSGRLIVLIIDTSRDKPPATAGGSDKDAFVARTATSTVIALSVWFCSTIGNSNRSPKFRKRGADGRAIKGRRAVIVDSPEQHCLPPATATAITR